MPNFSKKYIFVFTVTKILLDHYFVKLVKNFPFDVEIVFDIFIILYFLSTLYVNSLSVEVSEAGKTVLRPPRINSKLLYCFK